jgi:hypothetical protein
MADHQCNTKCLMTASFTNELDAWVDEKLGGNHTVLRADVFHERSQAIMVALMRALGRCGAGFAETLEMSEEDMVTLMGNGVINAFKVCQAKMQGDGESVH